MTDFADRLGETVLYGLNRAIDAEYGPAPYQAPVPQYYRPMVGGSAQTVQSGGLGLIVVVALVVWVASK